MTLEPPLFTSMGLFIIDEIHFSDGSSIENVLGGGGTFAIVGSRMVLGSDKSKRCGWIVDLGNDCPKEAKQQLDSWDTGAIVRYHPDRQCIHGWNGYGENEHRTFKFTSPPIDISLADLDKYPQLLASKSYHFIVPPKLCLEILARINGSRDDSPIVVWEPEPDDCRPEMLEQCLTVLPEIDILSPNAAECAALLGQSEPTTTEGCEQVALHFLPYMTKTPDSAVVLRCGAMGSVLASKTGLKWFAPYHQADSQVMDPTGCGNTFVGAFATALVLTKNLEEACVWGTLASGASIEQHGPPKLEGDKWNGISMEERRTIYNGRQ